MNGTKKQRAGKQRIESLGIPKPRFVEWWNRGNKSDWSVLAGMTLLGGLSVLLLCQAWSPPFAYRQGEIPARDLITRVTFEVLDREATEIVREQRRREVLPFYRNRTQSLTQLRGNLKYQLFLLLDAPSYEELGPERQRAIAQFVDSESEEEGGPSSAAQFRMLQAVLSADPE